MKGNRKTGGIGSEARQEGGFEVHTGAGKGSAPTGQAGDDKDCRHSVELNVHTSALAVELKTQTSLTDEFVRLQTRLEVALEQVQELSARLDAAHYKIGYLEAHLQAKETLLLSLTEQLDASRRLQIEVEEAD